MQRSAARRPPVAKRLAAGLVDMATFAAANPVKAEVRRGYSLYLERCKREGVAPMSMNEWARVCVEAIRDLELRWPYDVELH